MGVFDSISGCHTLQVYDFDLDGDYYVLAGSNFGRAVNLGKKGFKIIVFLSNKNYTKWEPMELRNDGICNGQVVEYEADGDLSIFHYPHHEGKEFYLLINKTID